MNLLGHRFSFYRTVERKITHSELANHKLTWFKFDLYSYCYCMPNDEGRKLESGIYLKIVIFGQLLSFSIRKWYLEDGSLWEGDPLV